MIDSKARKFYQIGLIEPLLKTNWIAHLSPVTLTLCALCLGLLIPCFLPLGHSYIALICLALSGFCDTLDGSLARHRNIASDVGAMLDITSDRLVEFAILLALFLVDPTTRGLPCMLCMGSTLFCITTFLVVGIFSKNETEKSFYYSAGLIERAEAFLFFGAMILFPSAFFTLAYLFSALVFLTGIFRVHEFLHQKKV